MTDVTFTTVAAGAGTPPATFNVGDVPVLKFKLSNKDGTPLAKDMTQDASLSGTIIVSGPTSDPQRLFAATSMRASSGSGASTVVAPNTQSNTIGTFAYDSTSGFYTLTFWNSANALDLTKPLFPIPANQLPPLDSQGYYAGTPGRPIVPGTYTVWAYIAKVYNLGLANSYREVANTTVNINIGTSGPLIPRQVVLTSACNGCHVQVQAHGGSRQVAENCHVCHTDGARDKTASPTKSGTAGFGPSMPGPQAIAGTTCAADTDCAAYGTPTTQVQCLGATTKSCNYVADPTASTVVRFPVLIHDIHSAGLRSGWLERNNLQYPGQLNVNGTVFGDQLPMDLRNCTKCHADSGNACSASNPCAYGQACQAGKCVNDTWQNPSGEVCLTCHDNSAAWAHVQLNTVWGTPPAPNATLDPVAAPETPIIAEACESCHGRDGEFAVAKVHDPSGYNAYALTPLSYTGALPWFRSYGARAAWINAYRPSFVRLTGTTSGDLSITRQFGL
jgi:hypothetical protein